MEVSAVNRIDSDKCTTMDKCSEIKLTKSSKIFSIESIIANTNKNTSVPIRTESPVNHDNYYCPQNETEYPMPPLPPPPGSHYGNMYNNAWFGGLFNAQIAANLSDMKDVPAIPDLLTFTNPSESSRVPNLFNDPSLINAYQREKLAQYFMNSLRAGGPTDCDKLTEIIFRSGYPGMSLFDPDKSRTPPFQESTVHQHHPPSEDCLTSRNFYDNIGDQSRHLSSSSSLIGGLPLMSKQIQGGTEIHQQATMMSQHDKVMIDTASNDSCSDDLSLTLSPGESNKQRGEWMCLFKGTRKQWSIEIGSRW